MGKRERHQDRGLGLYVLGLVPYNGNTMKKSIRLIAEVLIALLVFASCDSRPGTIFSETEVLRYAVDYGIKQGIMELISESGGLRTYHTDGFTAPDGTYIKGTAVLESDGSFQSIILSEVSVFGRYGKYELKQGGGEAIAWLEEYEVVCSDPALDGFAYKDASDDDFTLVLHFSDGSTAEHDFWLERDEEGYLRGDAYFYFAGLDYNVHFPVGEFTHETRIERVEIRQVGQVENMDAYNPSIFEVWIMYDNAFEEILEGEGLVFLVDDDGIVNFGDDVYADVEGTRYYANIEIAPTPHTLMEAHIEQTKDFLEGDEFDASAFTVWGMYKDGTTESISTTVSINSFDGLVHQGSKVQATVYLNEDTTPTVIEAEIQCYEITRIYPTSIPLYLVYKDGPEPEYFSAGAIAVYEKEAKDLTRTLGKDDIWYDIAVDTSAINTTSGVPATITIYAGPESNPVSTSISTEAIRRGNSDGSLPKKILDMGLRQDRTVSDGDYLVANDFSVQVRYIDLSIVTMPASNIQEIVSIQIPSAGVNVGDRATVTTTLSSSNSLVTGTFTTTFLVAVLNN